MRWTGLTGKDEENKHCQYEFHYIWENLIQL